MPGTLRSFIRSVVQVFGRLLSGCSTHWWPFEGLFFVGLSLGEHFLLRVLNLNTHIETQRETFFRI